MWPRPLSYGIFWFPVWMRFATVPADRWNRDEFYDPNPDKARKIKTERGGFIEGRDLFDNEFFNIFRRRPSASIRSSGCS